MSRKKGIIENLEWNDENINKDNPNQDNNTQKLIEEMYNSLNKNQISAQPSEESSLDDSDEPVKTLWEIALESADEETEYEKEESLLIIIAKKVWIVTKKAVNITFNFIKKTAVYIKLLAINRLKNKKNNIHTKPTNKNQDIPGHDIKNTPENTNTLEEDDEGYVEIKKGVGTTEIAFISANRGSGTTYTAFICASVLSKKYKVCVLEQNPTQHFSSIFEYLNSEVPYQRKMFKYNGIDYYFNLTYDQFLTEFRSKYDFVIIDYSSIDDIKDYVQVARSDKIFAIIDGTYWRINESEKIVQKLKEKDKAKAIVYLNPIREPIAEIKKICFPNKIIKVPYVLNPFKPDKETTKLFFKILKIKY